jgi:hypothetical protein
MVAAAGRAAPVSPQRPRQTSTGLLDASRFGIQGRGHEQVRVFLQQGVDLYAGVADYSVVVLEIPAREVQIAVVS